MNIVPISLLRSLELLMDSLLVTLVVLLLHDTIMAENFGC
jgi:hypothetical protein